MLATSAHTLGEPMARRLPLGEAARVLGLNERTIRRRLQAGSLNGVKDDTTGRWTVDVPDTPDIDPDTPDAAADDLRQRVAVLEVQLEATRDQLATTTTTLDRERAVADAALDLERQRYADQRSTFETMLRLLPAPERRRWRWPWRRERR